MLTSKRALWLAVVFILPCMTSLANADASFKEDQAKLQKACKGDVERLCSDVTPGEGRILSCFEAKEDQLSAGCKKTWSSLQASISKKMDKANLAFRKECGTDINKFCSDVPEGRGRILECLNEHHAELSDTCKKTEAKIKERAAKYFG